MSTIRVVEVRGKKLHASQDTVPVVVHVPRGYIPDRLMVMAPDDGDPVEHGGPIFVAEKAPPVPSELLIDERSIRLLPQSFALLHCLRAMCVKVPNTDLINHGQLIPLSYGIGTVLVVFGKQEFDRAVEALLIPSSVTCWKDWGATGVKNTPLEGSVAPFSAPYYIGILPADPLIIIDAQTCATQKVCGTDDIRNVIVQIQRARYGEGIPRWCKYDESTPQEKWHGNNAYPFDRKESRTVVICYPGDTGDHAFRHFTETSSSLFVNFVFPHHLADKNPIFGRRSSQVERLIGKSGIDLLFKPLVCGCRCSAKDDPRRVACLRPATTSASSMCWHRLCDVCAEECVVTVETCPVPNCVPRAPAPTVRVKRRRSKSTVSRAAMTEESHALKKAKVLQKLSNATETQTTPGVETVAPAPEASADWTVLDITSDKVGVSPPIAVHPLRLQALRYKGQPLRSSWDMVRQ